MKSDFSKNGLDKNSVSTNGPPKTPLGNANFVNFAKPKFGEIVQPINRLTNTKAKQQNYFKNSNQNIENFQSMFCSNEKYFVTDFLDCDLANLTIYSQNGKDLIIKTQDGKFIFSKPDYNSHFY